jgi:ABC-type antimicrobial peptide transport system permease subunit
MFKNYIKLAWRSLIKNRASSLINVSGLAVGMAVSMLIGLWIYDELSFNKCHRNYDRIAQIMTRGVDASDGPFVNNSVQYPLATELQTNYADNFRHFVKASWAQDYILGAGDKKISGKGQFMDEGAPEMLTLKMKAGNWKALHDPHSIVLSASLAKSLFGNADPLNQIILISNKINVKVTGVYEDLPVNSQFGFVKFLSPWNLWEAENDWIKKSADNWDNHFLKIYAEIKPGLDFKSVYKNISNAELKNLKKLENEQEAISRNPQVFLLQMSDWHLHPIDRNAVVDDKPVRMVWMVGIIGVFILLLACINFMNLSTARSEKRAREVGIRKTIGSIRKQLVYQFFSESFLVVIFSFIVSCLLVNLLLPWFNNLSGKEMTLPLNNFYFWLITGAFIFITGLLAGSYPALYLSSFKPIRVLKGNFHTGQLASLPRKILVVMQFTVSVALIICTVVVYRQLQFARNRTVGYDREGLIMVDMRSDDFYGKYDLLRSQLLNTGVVSNMSESMGMLTELVSGNDGFDWNGRNPNKNESFGTLAVTHEHGKTIGWKFIAGRDFSRKFISDSSGVVINEAAEKYLELKNSVGEVITWKWKDNKPVPYTILGVVKNMVMESPYEPVEPTMFFIKPLNGGVSCINIRVKPGVTMNTALPLLEAVFKKIIPSVPFEYKFADKEYAQKFATEERTGKLAGFFAVLAIFISCLGLFGMASFMAEQRTKEIGVRKVLGASVFNLWSLLSGQFVLLVVISFFIAAPIAFYFMNNWLQNYQYRTELSWWIFAAAGSASLLITLLTVSFQSIKAAIANPVKSLRTE